MITPQEVIDYTEFDVVKTRDPRKLMQDIIQAKHEIYQFVGHKFDKTKYQTIPEEVVLACLKLTEFFALYNSDASIAKGYKSEKIGDYSYTVEDGSAMKKPILSALLADYVQDGKKSGDIRFKMRSI